MLKRIKETLTCSDSSSGTRLKLKSHHLLHSDKSTYFYKSKLGNIKNILYSSKISIIPLVLSAFGLLLVLGLSVGCMGGASGVDAYAEGESKAADEVVMLSDNASVSLSLADTANNGNMTITDNNKSIQEQVDTTSNTGYIAVDFHVTATNIDKYDVYVQSSNSALIGETNKGKVESISSDTAYADMVNNTGWGYAVAEGSNVNAETLTYKPIQTSTSSAVDSGSATNTTINKDYTLAFAANLTGATADHYKSNITLSVAAGATQVMTLYSVTYNTNGSTGGSAPVMQIAESNSEIYTFITPGQNDLVRTDYALAGWSENSNTILPEYGLGETITLDKTNHSKTLYAVWTNWDLLVNMQDMTPAACETTDIGSSKQLYDIREPEKSYWVTRLKDGNCWMTQNLSFDPTGKTLTSSDSDVKNDTVLVKSSSWSATDAASINWEISSAGSGHGSYGGYYSWQAATANTGTSDPGGASGSICPKAWRLPHSGTIGSDSPSFMQLVSGISYGSALVSSPYYFVYGGYIDGGSVKGASNGYYWSATGNNTPNAFYLNISSTVSVTNDRRTYGMFVRCVAR